MSLLLIETAIRRQSGLTAQVGRKSLHTITVDFDFDPRVPFIPSQERASRVIEGFRRAQGPITQKYVTGKTNIGPVSLGSLRDDFRLISPRVQPRVSASFSVIGQTASGVAIMPNINYQLDFVISLSPKLVKIKGSHDGYPSYNVSVNGRTVYDYVQGHLGELFGKSDVAVLRNMPWV
jgi:hypothetical protein